MHCKQQTRRVLITGVGVVSVLGTTRQIFVAAVGDDHFSGFREAEPEGALFSTRPCQFRGQIDEFGDLRPPVRKAIRKALKLLNRETLLAVAAGQQALAESAIEGTVDSERIGVIFGAGNVCLRPEDFAASVQACRGEAGRFDFDLWGGQGLPEIEPLWLLKCLPNMPACYLAMLNDLRGPNNSVTEGPASANLAVNEAFHGIRDGAADAALVGATGSLIEPLSMIHEWPDDGQREDRNGRGTDDMGDRPTFGEGAAAFVLEERDLALQRGVRPYGEVLGVVSSCETVQSDRTQQRHLLAETIGRCLDRANLEASEIDQIRIQSDRLEQCIQCIGEANAVIAGISGPGNQLPSVESLVPRAGATGAGEGAIELAAGLLNDRRTYSPSRGRVLLNVSLSADGQASCLAVRLAHCDAMSPTHL
jgi:3-oxoacyl-[acyl-carrier-protein] synthase II